MMGLFIYLLFMIPLLLVSYWWVICFSLILGFFYFLNTFCFFNFFGMISYSFGGDVLSLSLIFLSFWVVFLMLIASYLVYRGNIYSGEFLFVNLVLLFLLICSFSTMNVLVFYLFFESSLIPTLFLIFGWGYQPERLGAGFYLLFYTLFVSLPLLLCIFMVGYFSMTLFYFLIEIECNFYIYLSLIGAFLIKMPMIFVHFWLPKAHVEAPISGSMILAGVLLKLGGYGLLRVFYFIYSYSVNYSYIWISLSLCGSVLVGVLCLFQVDIKSMIAYSSVAHMGLVLCGIMTFNYWGFYGSLILMIGHGLCSSGLFCLANIVYESLGSRSFLINSGLLCFMPSLALFWFILSSNNMASPVSLNFMGEVMLINSLMGWSAYGFFFLGLSSFLSCCYSIYLFSYVYHGSFCGSVLSFGVVTVREYVLIFFHLVPLNFLILKSDIFVFWL